MECLYNVFILLRYFFAIFSSSSSIFDAIAKTNEKNVEKLLIASLRVYYCWYSGSGYPIKFVFVVLKVQQLHIQIKKEE